MVFTNVLDLLQPYILYRYNLEDFYAPLEVGMEMRGPLWTPVRLMVNLTMWAFLFLVPIFYWRIYKFRNTQVGIGNLTEIKI